VGGSGKKTVVPQSQNNDIKEGGGNDDSGVDTDKNEEDDDDDDDEYSYTMSASASASKSESGPNAAWNALVKKYAGAGGA
jgi:hypothetical protein